MEAVQGCIRWGGGVAVSVAERRGKEVHREAETKDGGRKRWRRQWGRRGKHGR